MIPDASYYCRGCDAVTDKPVCGCGDRLDGNITCDKCSEVLHPRYVRQHPSIADYWCPVCKLQGLQVAYDHVGECYAWEGARCDALEKEVEKGCARVIELEDELRGALKTMANMT